MLNRHPRAWGGAPRFGFAFYRIEIDIISSWSDIEMIGLRLKDAKEKFILPEMKRVPAGIFRMGSDHLADEGPVHSISVDEFQIAAYPVTRLEYADFLEVSKYSPPSEWANSKFMNPRQPVVSVTWDEAAAYCRWLGAMTGLGFRLPTEAEREMACRGGLEGCDYPWGNGIPEYRPVKSTWDKQPDTVGLYPPNGYGLYDMEGNVHEWCSDWYGVDYYDHSPQKNPQGPERGERRVSRGGAWRHSINVSRCSARSCLIPSFRYNDYGFRVACSAP